MSVGLEYKSVDCSPSVKELEVSRKEMVVLDISLVNLIEGCRLLAGERNFISTPSINLYQETMDDSSSCFSNFPVNVLA